MLMVKWMEGSFLLTEMFLLALLFFVLSSLVGLHLLASQYCLAGGSLMRWRGAAIQTLDWGSRGCGFEP